MSSKGVFVAAVDDTSDCWAAVDWLASNIVRDGQQLKLLMVVPGRQGPYSSSSPLTTPRSVDDLKKRFPNADDAQIVVSPCGNSEAIGQAILDRAHELHATVLALAPHAKTAVQRVLTGSITDYCLRHGCLPVLVVQGVAGEQISKHEA